MHCNYVGVVYDSIICSHREVLDTAYFSVTRYKVFFFFFTTDKSNKKFNDVYYCSIDINTDKDEKEKKSGRVAKHI